VIDPAQNIDGKMDVAIIKDKIAMLSGEIPAKESSEVIDARGKLVTPGLIDMHCHVYEGVLKTGACPWS
jgi:dihydroorotase